MYRKTAQMPLERLKSFRFHPDPCCCRRADGTRSASPFSRRAWRESAPRLSPAAGPGGPGRSPTVALIATQAVQAARPPAAALGVLTRAAAVPAPAVVLAGAAAGARPHNRAHSSRCAGALLARCRARELASIAARPHPLCSARLRPLSAPHGCVRSAQRRRSCPSRSAPSAQLCSAAFVPLDHVGRACHSLGTGPASSQCRSPVQDQHLLHGWTTGRADEATTNKDCKSWRAIVRLSELKERENPNICWVKTLPL